MIISRLRRIAPLVQRRYWHWNTWPPGVDLEPVKVPDEADKVKPGLDVPDFVNDGTAPLKVPGFGQPIDLELQGSWQSFWPITWRFRHGANDFSADRMTAREIAMLKFMDTVTDKKRWEQKVFDEHIVEKWRAEVGTFADELVSEKAFDWCMTELREKAKEFQRDGFVRTLESASTCAKSDSIISHQQMVELRTAVQPLLDVFDEKKDWHPKSDDQVLNLVHPSLFPLVYGKTRVLPTGVVGLQDCTRSTGKGVVTQTEHDIPERREGMGYKSELDNKTLWSTRFQWLPSEVKFVGGTGTDVNITSYINNLHPNHHQPLYKVIEAFISKSIPLWNSVLVKGYGCASLRVSTNTGLTDPPNEPEWFHDVYANTEVVGMHKQMISKVKEYLAMPEKPDADERFHYGPRHNLPQNEEDWTEDEAYQALQDKWFRVRKIVHPEPGDGPPHNYGEWLQGKTVDILSGPKRGEYVTKLEEEFRKQGLQVIVKLSSIELSPDKPDYPGGSWHLEGMLNEHIVATSIYYYDVDNVTESRIRFRTEAKLDERGLEYEQSDHDPLAVTFGTLTMWDEPAVQEVGSIKTQEGRLIAFPNTLQHKVDPFSLVDKTKSGHRRYLVLWLVDPHCRIASTANVPPQQSEWFEDGQGCDREGTMSLEEAKRYRLELMQERTTFVDTVEGNFDAYNLCEH
ncbi:hypothetical protein BDV96DRAFT_563037 [Lophiotrema nucula]|uniref:Uncharacterized protein n=1 Tax=Lophiotrema nucula TaxID=690887 RepID=A0A6A5ZSX8_9PLEO|nr:hypothetical protein BDV96DRAFT_563037 [Lophiotrema nucula]